MTFPERAAATEVNGKIKLLIWEEGKRLRLTEEMSVKRPRKTWLTEWKRCIFQEKKKKNTHARTENSRGIRRLYLKRQYLAWNVESEYFWHVLSLNTPDAETWRCITAINLRSVISAPQQSLLDRTEHLTGKKNSIDIEMHASLRPFDICPKKHNLIVCVCRCGLFVRATTRNC